MVQHAREKTGAHSLMCDTNYKLEIARQFSGHTFYLPHSVDFRGRAYPIPPHLSHVGPDLSRGIMMFAVGKPLGKNGLRWMKINLANAAGYDKAPMDGRVAFVDERLDEIYDSADHPNDGRGWWTRADKPWQCLASCIELTAALRSPNIEEFVSHVPCQQDGSCNGLQHYAALGRDVEGAQQVNLSPSDRPGDVYAGVASLISSQVDKDAKNEKIDPIVRDIAQKLVGKVNRKIIKQAVMTNVYGVTRYGARKQIQERLKEYNIVDPADYVVARRYLANGVFNSLGKIFEKAQLIQHWLTDSAREITLAVPPDVALKCREIRDSQPEKMDPETIKQLKKDPKYRYPQTTVKWTPPTGYEVIQPYLKCRSVQLKTVMQALSLRIPSVFDIIDAKKQITGFPPNFVHSLDAAHMFNTALACENASLTFASVHDCFWTHACSVDHMNRLLREEFVRLHSAGVLERLRNEFMSKYGDYEIPDDEKKLSMSGKKSEFPLIRVQKWRKFTLPDLPVLGEFDVRSVLNSEYFFS